MIRLGKRSAGAIPIGVILVGLQVSVTQAAPLNPALDIGIVQRFGEDPQQKLVLKALPGDRLTVTFPDQDQQQTLEATQVQFEIALQPLVPPRQIERVVLSNHRSFESAETSANRFRALGVDVELAQPDNWQVWAKRDRFPSTVSRLLLIHSLKNRDIQSIYLDRKPYPRRPFVSWVVNGYRYNRTHVKITAGNNQIQVGQQLYGGTLWFQPNAYGSYTLVNGVPLETYLRGVVPYEIGPGAPDTAIQAQAILARTYALRNLRRFEVDNYELCATTQCQVYKGLSAANGQTDRAIASTAGQVLTYNNELIDALYSSTTGGVTAPFEDVWEGQPRPYLTAKVDAYPNTIWDLGTRNLSQEANFRDFIGVKQGFNEDGWRYLRWQREASLAALNKDLKTYLTQQQHPLSNFQTIQNLTVTQRSAAGRVQNLQVQTDVGALNLVKDEVLRAFEAPNSLLFYVEPRFQANPKALKGFAFIGGGLGHAVGLSQTGSYALSRQGWSAGQILEFYYPGTTLQPLTESIVYWTPPTIQPVANALPANPPPEGLSLFGWKIPGFGLKTVLGWFKAL